MKYSTITIKTTNPQATNTSKEHFSKAVAKIIIDKIPKNLLNNFIEQIETNNTMNKHSLY